MGKPEQSNFPFVADEAIRRCYDLLCTERPVFACGALWTQASALYRILWLHAAQLDGGECIKHWPELTADERVALMLALERMVDFFQHVGQNPSC